MVKQFRGFIEWDYTSMMSTGLRRLLHPAEFAETHEKVFPRANYVIPYISTFISPLGESFGLSHSFEAMRLIKRSSALHEKTGQEALDPPELAAAAELYNVG